MKNYSTQQKYIIFDVDRTLINGTAWFYACTCPDLLLEQNNIQYFIGLNNNLFSKGTSEQKKVFREKTLELIEKNITEAFIKLVETIDLFRSIFRASEYSTEMRFYAAGYFTLRNLIEADENAINFIKLIKRFYGNQGKILFLSSGYYPFMRGIIDAINTLYFEERLHYEIVCSKIEVSHGLVEETYFLDQFQKLEYVKNLINSGKEVVFMADDSTEVNELQNVVIHSGGYYFQPILNPISRKLNWDVLMSRITKKQLKKRLKESNTGYALSSDFKLNQFETWLDQHNNKIGIVMLSISEFEIACNKLYINSTNSTEEFYNLIMPFVYKKNEFVYLRSNLYYYWLPSYITMDSKTYEERFRILIDSSSRLFFWLYENDFYNSYQVIDDYNVKAILYMSLDYLFESLLFLLNSLERESLLEDVQNNNSNLKILSELCQNISHLLVGLLFDRNLKNIVDKVWSQLRNFKLPVMENAHSSIHYMRELDDNIAMLKSALSIADTIKKRAINLTHIISFPYGGIALGYILNSVLAIINKQEKLPFIINCYFSSKQKERKEKNVISPSILEHIPYIYKNSIESIKKGNSTILLYDNNVTTFSTLNIAKKQLSGLGNLVYATVVAVNYDNICNYLLNINPYETLDPSWQYTLDFNPVCEYITAFNTWGTSEKSKELENLFKNSSPKLTFQPNLKKCYKDDRFIYKICRVHNIFDLECAINAGASMIGIHAVYHDKINYYLSENRFKPFYSFSVDTTLPVANFESFSIREMIKRVPKYMEIVLVIERPCDIYLTNKCCELYGMNKSNITLQLQCRVTHEQIMYIKKYITHKIIVSIGIFQDDFVKYFWYVHDILNAKHDYILLDFSKHQPDIISGISTENYEIKEEILNRLSYELKENRVPIFIADDTSPNQINTYINILDQAGVYVKGLDMQNSTELDVNEQKYSIIFDQGNMYPIRIRKSISKLSIWKKFIEQI